MDILTHPSPNLAQCPRRSTFRFVGTILQARDGRISSVTLQTNGQSKSDNTEKAHTHHSTWEATHPGKHKLGKERITAWYGFVALPTPDPVARNLMINGQAGTEIEDVSFASVRVHRHPNTRAEKPTAYTNHGSQHGRRSDRGG